MQPLHSGPLLDAGRLARRKEHLMAEITRTATSSATQRSAARQPGQWWRSRTAVITAITAVALAGGTVAAATMPAVFRQDNGVVAIDGSALKPAYQGTTLSGQQLADLQKQGKANFSANNQELACQGISLYFDTEAERQVYLTAFQPRWIAAMAQEKKKPTQDPCAAYASSPRFVQRSH
jgi:hypothetical protein